MEGEVTSSEQKAAHAKSPHMMCGNALWGIAGAAVSVYFLYLSFSRISSGDYSWPHSWWTVFTYLVWMVLVAGLLTETGCWRERLFFGVVLVAFLLGLVLSAWAGVTPSEVREVRVAWMALWGLAAIASLMTIKWTTK